MSGLNSYKLFFISSVSTVVIVLQLAFKSIFIGYVKDIVIPAGRSKDFKTLECVCVCVCSLVKENI